jgi:hypothetical protein
MSSSTLKPLTRATALVCELLAFARPRHDLARAPKPLDVLPAKIVQRRKLPQEELAQIDEMSLLIGPAFLATMARLALEAGAKK